MPPILFNKCLSMGEILLALFLPQTTRTSLWWMQESTCCSVVLKLRREGSMANSGGSDGGGEGAIDEGAMP